MAAVCIEAEKSEINAPDTDFLNETFTRIDQSIAYGALFTAHHLRVRAIVAFTESGSSALWMSRHNIDMPIYALTPNLATRRNVSLFRNVHPLELSAGSGDRDVLLAEVEKLLLAKGLANKDDMIVVTWGDPMGQTGGTNALKITKIGDR
jgi:pyruvate kinase